MRKEKFMAEKVIRRQFRGCLKEDAREGTRLCMAGSGG